MSIIDNYNRIIAEIKRIAQKAGRNPDDIVLIAVSKTFPAEIIQQAIDNGITLFGENRVQEAKAKIPQLKGTFTFHLVGHLQSNKAKDAVKLFDCIHSIDKLSTAIEVDKEAKKINKIQNILIEVNTSGEQSKFGIEPAKTLELCKGILELHNVNCLGLMTVGPLTDNRNKIREAFKTLRLLKEEINNTLGITLKELSMGMSGDFDIAIEEGATMLRIGTAIFGQRMQ
ncbi:MAG: YggS family pyridoxal phosphate-dependent enzyme [Spirochaetes bacterium]|nr:YggS family pyridoxal phosphate-dependent enzyme [Spirochaetota bacterium]